MMEAQERQKLVTRFKTFRTEGLSRNAIASRLNSEKVMTPAGKPWTDILVGAFMTREGITGEKRSAEKIVTVTPNKKENAMSKSTSVRKAKTSTTRRAKVSSPSVPEFRDISGGDRDLADIVVNVINGDLTREQKLRVIGSLI